MIYDNFNSIQFLNKTFHEISNWRSNFKTSYELAFSTIACSSITILVATIAIPIFLFYEINMSICRSCQYLLSPKREIKEQVIEHLMAVMELPCLFTKYAFATMFPCIVYDDLDFSILYYTKEQQAIKPIQIDDTSLIEMRSFLDETYCSGIITRDKLLELASKI